MAATITPMLFSVSYAGLWGQDRLDVKAFIAKAAALGYPAVELMAKRPHLSILDTGDAELDEIGEAARDAGVAIGTIAGYTDFTGGKASAEVPFVEMQIAYVGELARIAKRLGARIVRIFTGYTTTEGANSADWNTCLTAVRECASAAAAFGVKIGVQNHHDIGVSFEAYREFLDEVDHPNIGAMFDPRAPALHGDDLRACAIEMAPRMIQTTPAAYVRLRRFSYEPGLVNYKPQTAMVRAVPLGEGMVDLDAFFDGLRAGGFSGYACYEMCSPLRGGPGMANLDATAAASLAKLNSLIA